MDPAVFNEKLKGYKVVREPGFYKERSKRVKVRRNV
jgi:hypothetical protein